MPCKFWYKITPYFVVITKHKKISLHTPLLFLNTVKLVFFRAICWLPPTFFDSSIKNCTVSIVYYMRPPS